MKKELREKVEVVSEQNLDRLKTENLSADERKDLVSETKDFLVILNSDEEAKSKAEAEKERCKLDRDKTVMMTEVDAKKSQFSWLRFGADLAITLIPMAIGAKFFKDRYYEGMQFEKEGHWTAKSTKDLFSQVGITGERLPKGRK